MIDWTTAGHADADDGLVNHFTMLGATFAAKYAMAKINGAAAGKTELFSRVWRKQEQKFSMQDTDFSLPVLSTLSTPSTGGIVF